MSIRSQASSLNASIEKSSDGKRHTIGGILTGKFKTAFPDGKPGDATTAEKDTKKTLKEGQSEVVLFTDFDFLNNLFSRYQSTDNMRPVNARNSVLALNLVDYLVTGEKHLGSVNVKGDTFRPFEVIEKLEAERQAELNKKNEKIDKEIQAANQALEEELAKINQDMQAKQRDASVQMRVKSQQIQAQLEPFVKYMKPDGSISLDREKDAETIQKLVKLQKEMNSIRQQVQEETRKAIIELQKQIQIKQEEASDKIAKLEKEKRKDRKEGREKIEKVERTVQILNMTVMPLFVTAIGLVFFNIRRNKK